MASATSSAKTAPKKKVVKAPTNHPSTLKMVQDAIEDMHDPKGVPAIRIKSYISEKYKDIDPNSLKYRLRQALKKGIEKGVIIQSKSTADKPVLLSRFKLVKQKPEKKEKEKKAKPTTKIVKSSTDKEKTTAKKSPKKTKAVTGKTKEKETNTKTTKVKTPVKKTTAVKPKPKTAKPKVHYLNTARHVYLFFYLFCGNFSY